MPAQLSALQSNRLLPPSVAGVDHQKTRSISADGTEREGNLVGDFRPAVGPPNQTRGLVLFESGFEAAYIQLVSVLDQRSLLVISPACGAISAHYSPTFS